MFLIFGSAPRPAAQIALARSFLVPQRLRNLEQSKSPCLERVLVAFSGYAIFLTSCSWHGLITPSSVNGRGFPIRFLPRPSYKDNSYPGLHCHLTNDSATGRIELEYIVVDPVMEKRLELVNGTHVLGINSLLSISLVYLYIRHPAP
jgi:hypothetical protein